MSMRLASMRMQFCRKLPYARDQACHHSISGRRLSDPDAPSPNQETNQESLGKADGFRSDSDLLVAVNMSQHMRTSGKSPEESES